MPKANQWENGKGNENMTKIGTLCHILNDGKILLIKKKRGIGMGFWNAAGGKVEEGEDIKQAAVREVEEEIGLTPINPEKVGIVDFYLGKDLFMTVYIFLAEKFRGNAVETDEALPRWFDINDIPYNNMWGDDEHWMPLMLRKEKFTGKFYFDEEGKKLLSHELKRMH